MYAHKHPLASNPEVAEAFKFAIKHHGGQKRKYTEEPYVVHLLAVSITVHEITHDVTAVIAAILHDVVEDTPATLDEVRRKFGGEVAELVAQLSNVSQKTDGNREARKEIDRQHFANGSPTAQTIKLADLIDNAESLVKHDPLGFGPVWMGEKRKLVPSLTKGDATLQHRAQQIVDDYYAKYGEKIARKTKR